MIDHQLKDDELVARDANGIIQLAKSKCIDRGEIEKGVKRGRCHVILEDRDHCLCGDVNLSKYSKMVSS